MEHANEIKVAVTGILAAISSAMGWFGWLVVVFVACMALDWFTGTAVAKNSGEWSSAEARKGCWHKVGSAVAVLVAVIFDWLIATLLENIPGLTLPFTYTVFLGPVVLVWYIVTELGSIVENAGLLGAKIPAFLVKAIKVLNTTIDSAGESISPDDKNE